MSFVHSKNSRVMVNDKHLSCQLTGYTVASERNLGETTALCDEGARYIPGLRAGSINLNGLFDGGTGAIDETIRASDGVQDGVLTSVMPDGFTIGKPAFLAMANLSSQGIESGVADTVSLTVETTPDDGIDHGRVIHGHTAETATGDTASVDDGAATSGGGVAVLHVTAASGTTPSLTVKVQHSADDSTYADLITFTAATDTTSERKTVTGSVNRYVRESHTISGTGTPSFTYAAAFARR